MDRAKELIQIMEEVKNPKVGGTYIFNPVFLDYFDSRVLKGKQIEVGAKVKVTKTNIDPLKKFVFIEDEKGNQMSVYKNSLDTEADYKAKLKKGYKNRFKS